MAAVETVPNHTPEEIVRMIDDLGQWSSIGSDVFAIKLFGRATPYFFMSVPEKGPVVMARIVLLEGWQTLHDWIRSRLDHNFGIFSQPCELPHFEAVVAKTPKGTETHVFRFRTGYAPASVIPAEDGIVRRLLWQVYGVMLRREIDGTLLNRTSAEEPIFARVETVAGQWSDEMLEIPPARPYTESVVFLNKNIQAAAALPQDGNDVIDLDLYLDVGRVMPGPNPHCVYRFVIVNETTKAVECDMSLACSNELGLKEMWQNLPPNVLNTILRRGRVPGEIKVRSQRVFRLMSRLSPELPFKLSIHDRLPLLEGR